MRGECSGNTRSDAFAERDAAHGETAFCAFAAFASDDDAFVYLHAFLLAFHETEVYAHGIADIELRQFVGRFKLGGFSGEIRWRIRISGTEQTTN